MILGHTWSVEKSVSAASLYLRIPLPRQGAADPEVDRLGRIALNGAEMGFRCLLAPMLLVGLGCKQAPSTPAPSAESSRQTRTSTAPLVELDGPEVLAEVRRGPSALVLVNLWATWCEPCIEEFPDFQKIRAAYRDRGVRVLFVNCDFPGERDAAVAFLRSRGAELPSYAKRGGDMAFIEALHPEWSGALPATFLFDAAGRLIRFWEGEVDYATLSGALNDALSKP